MSSTSNFIYPENGVPHSKSKVNSAPNPDVQNSRVKINNAVIKSMENLTDDTLLYIFLSKENAIDMHGRVSANLIYDMKPEVGFGIKANNTTSVEWLISSEHLYAAGIDFEDDPHGWQITMAFFGSVESDNSSEQLLSLHHFDVPFKSQNIDDRIIKYDSNIPNTEPIVVKNIDWETNIIEIDLFDKP